ncbi:MAG: hypothetical protein AAF587_28795 [Bacteroidota bacterium]
MNHSYIFLLPILLIWACKPQAPGPIQPRAGIPRLEIGPDHSIFFQDDSCREYALRNCNIACPEEWDDDLVYMVRFNPMDAREILYAYSPYPSAGFNLFRLNLETGETNMVVEYIHQVADWSIKDWIVLDRHPLGIWKVKSNGDSLQLLIKSENSSEQYRHPMWDSSGTRILVGQEGHNAKILDEQGNIIDSLPMPNFPTPGVSANFRYISLVRDSVFGYKDFHTNIFYPLRTALRHPSWTAWSPDNKKLVLMGMPMDGLPWRIFVFDIETGTERTLYAHDCWNYYYKFPVISSDGQWLVMQKWTVELKPGTAITRFRDVQAAFMHLETGEEYVAEFNP